MTIDILLSCLLHSFNMQVSDHHMMALLKFLWSVDKVYTPVPIDTSG